MLTFKKNWLWKYNCWCHDLFASKDNVHYSKTICPYFWGSVWNLVGMPSVWVVIFYLVGYLPSMFVVNLLELSSPLKGTGLLGLTIMAIVGWIIILLFVLFVCTCVHLTQKFNKKRKPKTNNKPSVIKEFIKAKKNKFCPMIEFKD